MEGWTGGGEGGGRCVFDKVTEMEAWSLLHFSDERALLSCMHFMGGRS